MSITIITKNSLILAYFRVCPMCALDKSKIVCYNTRLIKKGHEKGLDKFNQIWYNAISK